VRRNVSGATPTLKLAPSNSVTVRHVPLTLMLSPRWQSPRMAAQSLMVREVPPPPLVDSSRLCSAETAGGGRQRGAGRGGERRHVLPMISTMPVNMVGL
jgi:hypothetical protein